MMTKSAFSMPIPAELNAVTGINGCISRATPSQVGCFLRGKSVFFAPRPPRKMARKHIDQALGKAGWRVQDYKSPNLHDGTDVVLINFPLMSGHGFADYLLYVDGKAAGIIEAKKEGVTLIGMQNVLIAA